jgi:dihydrofolate reductase
MTDLVLVAAVAENGVIGVDGDMPWHLPEDLAHFKETTMGHPVIMGRTTYESIVAGLGEPLPGRTNVVLTSRDLDVPEGVVVVHGIAEALDVARDVDDEVAYVVGGATVYEQLMDRADRMILTEIGDSYEGDTYFPDWDESAWRESEREEGDGFAFVTYERA